MNKVVKMAVTAMTVLLMGGTVSTTASAATWHKGTPKTLRGNWKGKTFTYNGVKVRGVWVVGKKTIRSESPTMPGQTWKNLRYHKVGKGVYKVKGTCYQATMRGQIHISRW